MAWGECHEMELARIPSGYHQAAAIGIFFDVLDHAGDLIDRDPLRSAPVAPLGSIDAAEIALFIRPLIPNRDLIFPEVSGVRIALKEPKKLVNDRAQVEFFGCEDGKALIQIKPLLSTENRIRAGARAVAFETTLVQNKAKEAVILFHETIVDFGTGLSRFEAERRKTAAGRTQGKV